MSDPSILIHAPFSLPLNYFLNEFIINYRRVLAYTHDISNQTNRIGISKTLLIEFNRLSNLIWC